MSKLNLTIAKTHELSNRVVGMQLTAGNFIAIALSATQMTLGFIYLVHPVAWGYVLIAVIGVALAVLIERLTLGGLIAVRISNENIFALEEKHYEMLQEADRDETPRERQALDRRINKLKSDRKASIPVSAVGMVLSTCIGDLFWHTIFEPLGNPWLIYPLSFSCAMVIGLTFVYSELYKTIMDGTLGEILQDTHLKSIAVQHEGKNMQLGLMVASYDALQKDEEKRAPAQKIVEETLLARLIDFANGVEQASEQNPVNGERSNEQQQQPQIGQTEVKQIEAPQADRKPTGRTRYYECRSELTQMIADNPTISNQDIADHFGIAKSTANAWLDKLTKEVVIAAP